jgi:hypothetical protein
VCFDEPGYRALDIFKREIDLRQFAVSLGYETDRREIRRGSKVLLSKRNTGAAGRESKELPQQRPRPPQTRTGYEKAR